MHPSLNISLNLSINLIILKFPVLSSPWLVMDTSLALCCMVLITPILFSSCVSQIEGIDPCVETK